MRRWFFGIAACLAAVAIAAGGFYALRGRDAEAATAVVGILHPEQRTIRRLRNATGTIRMRVASVATQKGETVGASFTAPTFVTIIGEHALELVGMVDETDIAHVRAGNPVTFTVDAYPARDFPGRVESIAPKATIVSGVVNYEVTIQITDAAQLLKPDMTANLSIQTAANQTLLLPTTAVQRDGEGAFVYIAAKNGSERPPALGGNKKNRNDSN